MSFDEPQYPPDPNQPPPSYQAPSGYQPPAGQQPPPAYQPPQEYQNPGAYQAAPGNHGVPPQQSGGDQLTASGFFSSLFDFRMKEVITRKVMSVLYLLAFILIALVTLLYLVLGLSQGGLIAVLALIFVPLIGFMNLIMTRVWFEFIVVQFRQAELLEELVRQVKGPDQ